MACLGRFLAVFAESRCFSPGDLRRTEEKSKSFGFGTWKTNEKVDTHIEPLAPVCGVKSFLTREIDHETSARMLGMEGLTSIGLQIPSEKLSIPPKPTKTAKTQNVAGGLGHVDLFCDQKKSAGVPDLGHFSRSGKTMIF